MLSYGFNGVVLFLLLVVVWFWLFNVRSLVIFVVIVEVCMVLVLLMLGVNCGGVESSVLLLVLGVVACEAAFALCLLVSLLGGMGLNNGVSTGLFGL